MKKIMFFVCSLRLGGSEVACVRMANALAESHDVTIITIWGNAGLEGRIDQRIHLIHCFPRYVRGIANISGRLPARMVYRFYVRDHYDIEIAVGDGLESHIISGSDNPNKFSWVHMNLGRSGTKYSKTALKRYRQFKKIICVSENNRRCFENIMGTEFKTVVCYSPVDESEINTQAGRLLEDSLGNQPFSFIAVGRLERIKGFDRLIKAVSLLPEYDYQVAIYGEGSQKRLLEKMIQNLNLENRIALKGAVINPYPLIQKADALICSSYEESFGFTVVEAMMMKTCVLSTKCGGPEEIISEPLYGCLCDNSVEGLTNGMRRMIKGEHKIDTGAAYKRACQFNVKSCLASFSEAIEV